MNRGDGPSGHDSNTRLHTSLPERAELPSHQEGIPPAGPTPQRPGRRSPPLPDPSKTPSAPPRAAPDRSYHHYNRARGVSRRSAPSRRAAAQRQAPPPPPRPAPARARRGQCEEGGYEEDCSHPLAVAGADRPRTAGRLGVPPSPRQTGPGAWDAVHAPHERGPRKTAPLFSGGRTQARAANSAWPRRA